MNDSPSTTDRSTNRTPGPWHSDVLPGPRTGQTSGWIWGAGASAEEDSPTVAWIEEVHPADLRLMVAAPELLDALSELSAYLALEYPDADENISLFLDNAQIAIDKATTGDAP